MLKKTTVFQTLFTLFMYAIGALLLAGALSVPIYLALKCWECCLPSSVLARAFWISLAAGVGFFIFGLSLAAETVLLRFLFGLKLREGEFGFFSVEGIKWAFVNAMLLIVNLTFMDFMRLTPFLPLYYRLMGARIGRRVQINSKGIADVSMLEIGDDAVIGGDAVVIGHIAEHGKLKLKRTRIGRRVTVGLGAVVMPGADIGDGSIIAARSVLPKSMVVPPRSLVAGTPAKVVRPLDAPSP